MSSLRRLGLFAVVSIALSVLVNGQAVTIRLRQAPLAEGPTSPSGLLTDWASGFTYAGSAKLNDEYLGGCTFTYATEGGTTYSTSSKFYFVSNGCVAELNIPTLATEADPSNLPEATMSQGWIDSLYSGFYTDCQGADTNGIRVNGILFRSPYLYIVCHGYYDANNIVTKSAIRTDPTLANATYPGGGASTINPTNLCLGGGCPGSSAPKQGHVSSYFFPIPSSRQSAFGGTSAVGGQCMPRVERTSNGPSMNVLNVADIGVSNPVSAFTILAYGNELGEYNPVEANSLWNGTGCIQGAAFIEGTDTVIFIGTLGIGTPCYGATPSPCTDPEQPATGSHAYPYRPQYWMYDVDDLIAVKNGTKAFNEPVPYAYGEIPLPYTSASTYVMGGYYDASTKRLYFLQARAEPNSGEKPNPVLHAFTCTGCP